MVRNLDELAALFRGRPRRRTIRRAFVVIRPPRPPRSPPLPTALLDAATERMPSQRRD